MSAAVPIDLEIEGAVITSVLVAGADVDARVWTLVPDDFFSDDNKRIWRAILDCREAGIPIDYLTIANRLRERGQWEQTVTGYLEALAGNPVTIHAGTYSELLRTRSKTRQIGHLFSGLAAEALSAPIPDLNRWLTQARQKLEVANDRHAFELLTGDALDVRLPERDWLIKDLGIRPGPVTLFAGSSDSAKTLALQSLAVNVATGEGLVWNQFKLQSHGRVLHVDYEQGLDLTLFRYQRLALMNAVWGELWANLAIETSAKKPHLDAAGSLQELERMIRDGGYRLVIIDSLRAAFPTMEENNSNARQWLDKLKPISETTKAVMIPICHARKPGKDDQGGAQASVRGSAAIYEAAQQVIIFRREDDTRADSPIVVRPNKGRLGRRIPHFLLRVDDVSLPVETLPTHVARQTLTEDMANETGSLRFGLDVSVMSDNAARISDEVTDMVDKIAYSIARYPGINNKALRGECGVKSSNLPAFNAGLERLQKANSIRIDAGKGREYLYFPINSEVEPELSCQ